MKDPRNHRFLAFTTALATLFLLVVPLVGIAAAQSAVGLDAEPETDTNNLGEQHAIGATIYDESSRPFSGGHRTVMFEFFQGSPSDTDGNTPQTPDGICQTQDPPGNSSSCSFSYTQSTRTGTDRVCVWINDTPTMTGDNSNGICDNQDLSEGDDEFGFDPPEPTNDDSDVVQKTWVAGNAATRLDCNPETATNQTTTAHTITCSATNAQNQAIAGAQIDVEAVGANDPDTGESYESPDFSCTTGSDGRCAVTHGPGGTGTTANTGTTFYVAWIDNDNNNQTVEADRNESRDETTGGGARPEPDNTDVVEKAWTGGGQPSGGLDCTPETATNQTGASHTVTCTARNQQGQTVAGAVIDVEATGANDPDNGDSPTSPDFTCTAGSDGTCSFTQGPGGTGATTSAGTTTYRAWVDADNNNQTVEADTTEGRDNASQPGGQAEPDNTDVVDKNWTTQGTQTPTAFALDLTPDRATNRTGTDHVFTAIVTDFQGQPVSGATVEWEEQGPGQIEFESTTDANGEAEARVTSSRTGDQFVTATTQCAESGDCSDTSVKHWVERDRDGGGAGRRCDIKGTPGDDVLRGTGGAETICSFGGADSIIARGGNDRILSGRGRDIVKAGGGGDVVRAGGGVDTVRGGTGADVIVGKGRRDILIGGGGHDILRGNAGPDTIKGNTGRDDLVGHRGDDRLYGGRGRDTCRGGRGDDRERDCET